MHLVTLCVTGTRSVPGSIPTQSVGTISELLFVGARLAGEGAPKYAFAGKPGSYRSTYDQLIACNASSFAITPAAVCSPINCSRTLPLLSMM
ncbi:hypothetical protein AB7M22_000756 [Pseudomonas sp. ADAK2 TE3594]